MLTDKQRVELAIPAAMLYRLFAACVATTDDENFTEEELKNDQMVLEWLRVAAIEPVSRSPKLQRRVVRAYETILRDFSRNSMITVYLAVLHWLKDLLDRDKIALIFGSDFDKAVSAIIGHLETMPDEWSATEKSATKGAKRMRAAFEGMGYYV